jgi:serine/threonine protein kinase
VAVERVGAYEILRVLARGGMATVYVARQPALDRMVALKRLDVRADDPTLADRFFRESRIAAAFDHPNIVTVFDFFECDGVPYIAMELLPRGSLRPWIGHLTLPQAFGVLEGVLAGLAHAESRGVAHRDLKPENVLVTNDGAVKIADFGIAKAYARDTPALTQTGMPVGTATYMAPEQAAGRPVGPRTDL